MTRNDVNERLKALKMPQWKLAVTLNIAMPTLTGWLQGDEIRKERAEKIERALDKLETLKEA